MSSTSRNDSSKSRSDPFYLATMVFEVEDKLYRVPRYGFEGRSGSPFEICATLPSDGEAEGQSDDTPISLPVKKTDFESLLKVIYSPDGHQYTRNIFGTQPPTSKEEWSGVLHLSTMWCFDDIRQRAIEELSESGLGDSEKVAMGLQFSVSNWVAQGYAGIASNLKLRVNDLDISQEAKLALLTIRDQFLSEELVELARLVRLAELRRESQWYSHEPEPVVAPGDQSWELHLRNSQRARDSLDKIVREVFSNTLATLR